MNLNVIINCECLQGTLREKECGLFEKLKEGSMAGTQSEEKRG